MLHEKLPSNAGKSFVKKKKKKKKKKNLRANINSKESFSS
jgi:hypothetical protein